MFEDEALEPISPTRFWLMVPAALIAIYGIAWLLVRWMGMPIPAEVPMIISPKAWSVPISWPLIVAADIAASLYVLSALRTEQFNLATFLDRRNGLWIGAGFGIAFGIWGGTACALIAWPLLSDRRSLRGGIVIGAVLAWPTLYAMLVTHFGLTAAMTAIIVVAFIVRVASRIFGGHR